MRRRRREVQQQHHQEHARARGTRTKRKELARRRICAYPRGYICTFRVVLQSQRTRRRPAGGRLRRETSPSRTDKQADHVQG